MKGADALAQGGRKLVAALVKYKFVLLVILAGVVLLLLPGKAGAKEGKTPSGAEESFSVATLEKKLAQTLSRIEGAGGTTVVLTVQGGARRVLAQDVTTAQGDGKQEAESAAVVVATGSGTQEAVLLQEVYPKFQGALVVCPGGGEPTIRLKLMEAVSALTGLGSDKISICQGK